jgi:hypothetical protein
MLLRGIIQSGTLVENPPGTDRIELVLKLQGVGPGQPRTVIVPFELLLADQSLDPDAIAGHGFEAEASQAEPGRWVVEQITVAQRRVLREPEA